MSEKFCLKWNDFDSNVSKSFGKLRNEEYLHDVTLVGDDHTQISAHKLVLSACSEYFKEVFKRNKHSNTLMCLEGLSKQDLKNVLDYMYNGEVKIYQEELDRFLSVAQRFKLEGLLESQENEDSGAVCQPGSEFELCIIAAEKPTNVRLTRPSCVRCVPAEGNNVIIPTYCSWIFG